MGLQSKLGSLHGQRSARTHDDESLWACGFRCVVGHDFHAVFFESMHLLCKMVLLSVRRCALIPSCVGCSLGSAPQTRACECMHACWGDFDPKCCRVHQFAH